LENQDNEATLTPTNPILPASPPPPSTAQKVLYGKDGLRAGWGLAIFLSFFAIVIFLANVIAHKLHPGAHGHAAPGAGSGVSPYIFYAEAIPFLVTLFITWIMSKIEKRPNSVYGLGGGHKLSRFFSGLLWGVTCLSFLIMILVKAGFLVIDSRVLFGREILRYGAIWLGCFLMVGLLEEYLSRGYIQYTLTRGLAGLYQWAFKTPHSAALGFWTAAFIVSLLFGLGHGSNAGESPIGLLSAGLASLVFCLSLWRTGSLWWAIGFHASWDWAQSFLYGVADSGMMVQHHLLATHPVGRPILSGGTTGPEGSIFILAPIALSCFIIIFTLPRNQYGNAPEHSPHES
jgi:membrane protease YdiL (CAAX protease family)